MKLPYFLPLLLIASAASATAQERAQERLAYTAIHDPQFVPSSAANFLHEPDRVIGVVSGTDAKAYPAAILSQHGLVEDDSPSGPIAITW